MALISAPIDFFGLNYYRPHLRAPRRSGGPSPRREPRIPGQPGSVLYLPPELPRTVMGWPIVPEGLRDLLIRLHQESGGLPIYVTENGCAADDYLRPRAPSRITNGSRSSTNTWRRSFEAIDARRRCAPGTSIGR